MIEFEKEALPYSNSRYFINCQGEILDSSGVVLSSKVKANKKFVKLSWIDGVKDYEIGLIVAVVKFNIGFPTELWKEIEPIYIDNDTSNVNFINISYRFKNGPIEVKDMPGFYYIPFYSKYVIDAEGNLFSLEKKVFKSWRVSKPDLKRNVVGGYNLTKISPDDLFNASTSKHRLLALTFLRYESDPRALVINHINGIPSDNSLTNLEWTTNGGNNQHAYDNGLVHRTVKLLMKNLNDGTIQRFNSLALCARAINMSESFVFRRLYKTPSIQYDDGLMFKLDDGKDWLEITDVKKSGSTKEIITRNIFTGKLFIFESIAKAEEYTGVKRATIAYHCDNRKIEAVNGFNFKRLKDDDLTWPNHTEKHLKIYKMFPYNPTNGVTVEDENGNEVYFFESCSVADTALGLTPGRTDNRCHNKSTVGGLTFKYYRLTDNLQWPLDRVIYLE